MNPLAVIILGFLSLKLPRSTHFFLAGLFLQHEITNIPHGALGGGLAAGSLTLCWHKHLVPGRLWMSPFLI